MYIMDHETISYKTLIQECWGDRIFGTTLYLGGFSAHGFFADGFLFLVKELGFWTNPGHWVRVLDAAGSYMYFVL
jgi:hypothetical protein